MRFKLMIMAVCSMVYAETMIEFKQGWQLAGVPTAVEDMSIFDNEHIKIVWSFDSTAQQWQGYSPDAEISNVLEERSVRTLTALKPWQGVWINSVEDWTMNVVETGTPSEATNNVIELKEGWNLVTLPQNGVASDHLFEDAVVWKYGENGQWQVNDETLSFPSIESIKMSEGVWVKSDENKTIDVGQALSRLRTFETEAQMVDYIRTMIKMSPHHYYFDQISGQPETDFSSGDQAAKDATSTNLQEAGVDEGDIMKHDGTYIYNADNSAGKIVVTSFQDLSEQNYQPVNSIDMNNSHIVSMYLQDNRLSVISERGYYYYYAPEATGALADIAPYPYYYHVPSFHYDLFDVSNASDVKKLTSHTIEGYYQDSRWIDGKLYVISQFSPYVEYEYPVVIIDTICSTLDRDQVYGTCSMVCNPGKKCEEVCDFGDDHQAWMDNNCYQYNYDEAGKAWQYDYDNPIVKNEYLIPKASQDGNATALITPEKFYAPIKLDQRANITSISRFDNAGGVREETLSFLGNTHTTYASTTSLYLASNEYPLFFDFSHSQEQQMIYKFSLGDPIMYKGRGFVPGRTLNQFSMGEKDEYLRIATTSGWAWWGEGGTSNDVYTMKANDENLEIVGKLEGLGLENETIHAVRFMGDRGFVVTFERTDPLYTLDLSDPLHPKSVGELKIPGFSTYLHVVDENRVLSIGRDADETGRALGLQFQLFDITDFTTPKLADKLKIGNGETYSEAEYNHKAFAYRDSDLMFGIPFRSYDGRYKMSSEHFGIYQIDGMTITAKHTISSEGDNWGNVGRGLIFDMNEQTYGALLKGSNMICETVGEKE